MASAYSAEFSLVRSILYDYQNGTQPPPSTPSGYTDPTAQPIPLDAAASPIYTGNVVDTGGLGDTVNAADPFVMEYADGLALADVGWGELSVDGISQQERLAILGENIAMTVPYLDQVQSSNAAAHVLRSMKQAVVAAAVPGAFSDPTAKVLVVISSDAYVEGLAGLLKLHWQLAGYQSDFCAPGGALVFELRQSLDAPPETAQLPIPGGSKPGASFDVNFATFQNLLTNAIGQQYVQNPATEVPPGVLASVPLQ